MGPDSYRPFCQSLAIALNQGKDILIIGGTYPKNLVDKIGLTFYLFTPFKVYFGQQSNNVLYKHIMIKL